MHSSGTIICKKKNSQNLRTNRNSETTEQRRNKHDSEIQQRYHTIRGKKIPTSQEHLSHIQHIIL